MSNNEIDQFREAILSCGMIPPCHIQPGIFYRMPGVNKSQRNTAGYCKIFPDLSGWVIGDFSSDLYIVGRVKQNSSPSQYRSSNYLPNQTNMKQFTEKSRSHAKKVAKNIWKQARKASSNHQYLKAKGIKAYGLKQTTRDTLIIPLRIGGELHSLQFISPNGTKRFLKGGQVKGCYHSIGNLNNNPSILCIAEGYATGATIYEATGYPVAITFSAGNLLHVAKKMRSIFPNFCLVLCADNDYETVGNPGLTKAIEAANAVKGIVAIPTSGVQNERL